MIRHSAALSPHARAPSAIPAIGGSGCCAMPCPLLALCCDAVIVTDTAQAVTARVIAIGIRIHEASQGVLPGTITVRAVGAESTITSERKRSCAVASYNAHTMARLSVYIIRDRCRACRRGAWHRTEPGAGCAGAVPAAWNQCDSGRARTLQTAVDALTAKIVALKRQYRILANGRSHVADVEVYLDAVRRPLKYDERLYAGRGSTPVSYRAADARRRDRARDPTRERAARRG